MDARTRRTSHTVTTSSKVVLPTVCSQSLTTSKSYPLPKKGPSARTGASTAPRVKSGGEIKSGKEKASSICKAVVAKVDTQTRRTSHTVTESSKVMLRTVSSQSLTTSRSLRTVSSQSLTTSRSYPLPKEGPSARTGASTAPRVKSGKEKGFKHLQGCRGLPLGKS